MDLALNVNASSSDLLVTAKQAATEIFSDSNTAFQEIKNRPWYKSLLNMVTFQRGDKKMVVRNIRNLASLQSVYMEIYTKQLKSQDAELDSLMEQILSTQQFAYKMYISCVLRLKPQMDIGELSESEQQILLLLLSEFNRAEGLNSDERESLQRYNRGVSSGLCVSRPEGNLIHEQLEKIQLPEVFYRCVLEQCAVTGRLDPLDMPSNVSDAIQWLDVSERKKERIVASVKTELNDFGRSFFFEKYKEITLPFDESDFELMEEGSEKVDDDELAAPVLDAETNTPPQETDSPFGQLIKLICDCTATGSLGKPLLKGAEGETKNKQIAELLPTVLPVSKTVVEITKTVIGHLVFTTHALYWVKDKKFEKIPYAELQPNYLGTRLIGESTVFVYAPPERDQISILGAKAESLEKLLLEISTLGEYAESDVLTEFSALPKEIQLTYMRLLANIIRENGNHLHEVYRLAVQYGLHEHWDYISSDLDIPIEDVLHNYSHQIPYPNEDALAISLLRDLCTVYQYTKDSDVLTVPEKKYFSLIFSGSEKDRDAIIHYAQLEKQVIEQRIDAKSAQAVTSAFSVAAGAVGASVLAYSGAMALFWSTLWFNFIPGIGTLISAAVVGGSIVSGFLSSQNKKKLTEVETRQKMRDELMFAYRKAEETAIEANLADISSCLHEGALNIAARIGFQYADYTETEHTLLRGIRHEIITFMKQDQEACAQKKLTSNAKLLEDLPSTEWEKVLSNLTFASSEVSVDDVIGLYDPTFSGSIFGNFMGILFLQDEICFRKNKSTPIQRMAYFDMSAIDEKLTSIIIYGKKDEKIALNSINYSKITELLRNIVEIVQQRV